MRRGNWGVLLWTGWMCLALACPVVRGGEAEAKAFLKVVSAAQKGDVEAQTKLGLLFLRGENMQVDFKEAAVWLGKAAEQGNAEAQLNLSVLYETGRGVETDLNKAFEWLLKSATQGNAEAQGRISWYYWNGRVVKQDKVEASKWCRRAVDQGETNCLLRLGLCYADGIGMEKDEAKAFSCYFQAALQGNEEARQRTAIGYYRGQGIQKDAVEAYKWALIAGPNWNNGAKMIRLLERELSREQIEEALSKMGVFQRAKILGYPLDMAMPWARYDKGAASERMPFLKYSGAVVLPVTVGGVPLNLCLDTGANMTCVDDESAGKLPVVNIPSLESKGVGPKTETSRITAPLELKLPGVTIASMQLWRLPMKGMRDMTEQPIHGLLGVDIISRFVIEIDYEARTVQFFDPGIYHYEGKAQPLPVTYKEWQPCVRVKLTLVQGDPIEFDCPVDTGACGDGCLILGQRFVENQEVLRRVGKLTPRAGIGIGGVHEILLTRAKSVEIGGQVIETPLIELTAAQAGVFAESRDGVVAAGFWKRFKVILDLPHDRIYLEPNSHLKDLGRYNLCGFYPKPEPTKDGEWVIEKVFANTPASEVGLQSGDIVLEMDGKKYNLRHGEDSDRLDPSETPGDHDFLIRRDGKEMKIKMTLRELL